MIKELNELTTHIEEIDVTDLKENKTYKIDLPKPVGIKSMTVSSITVEVKLDAITDKNIENVTINWDIDDGYVVNTVNPQDEKLAVNVQGVESVINDVTSDDIEAYVDVRGKAPGKHTVEIKVVCKDTKITCTSLKKTIDVTITKKKN